LASLQIVSQLWAIPTVLDKPMWFRNLEHPATTDSLFSLGITLGCPFLTCIYMHEIRPFAFPKPYETGHHSCEISARIGYTSTIILYIFWLVVSNLFFHNIWDNPSH
jgi:hypothetical protein